MQEVLQWNIARDGPMEYCVQQIATNKGELGNYCHLRNQQQGMVCDNGVLHGVQNWATVIIGQSTTGYGVRQRSIAWYASIACHNT